MEMIEVTGISECFALLSSQHQASRCYALSVTADGTARPPEVVEISGHLLRDDAIFLIRHDFLLAIRYYCQSREPLEEILKAALMRDT